MLLSDVWRLSDVYLSVEYIRRNSRTERPRKTKIGTEVAHVTRDWDTTFKIKRSKVKVTRPFCLVGCTGRPTRTYSNGDTCVHDVYRVVSALAVLGGGISWRQPSYVLRPFVYNNLQGFCYTLKCFMLFKTFASVMVIVILVHSLGLCLFNNI